MSPRPYNVWLFSFIKSSSCWLFRRFPFIQTLFTAFACTVFCKLSCTMSQTQLTFWFDTCSHVGVWLAWWKERIWLVIKRVLILLLSATVHTWESGLVLLNYVYLTFICCGLDSCNYGLMLLKKGFSFWYIVFEIMEDSVYLICFADFSN